MDYKKLQIGNLITYTGRVNGLYNKVGKILSIDSTQDNHETFLLNIKNHKRESIEIRAYDKEIWPVTVDITHLEQIGILKELNRNVFSLESLTLIRPIFIIHEADGSIFNDRGFVVVEKPLSAKFTEEDIELNTTSVSSLHALQNYLKGKIIKEINWDLLL